MNSGESVIFDPTIVALQAIMRNLAVEATGSANPAANGDTRMNPGVIAPAITTIITTIGPVAATNANAAIDLWVVAAR